MLGISPVWLGMFSFLGVLGVCWVPLYLAKSPELLNSLHYCVSNNLDCHWAANALLGASWMHYFAVFGVPQRLEARYNLQTALEASQGVPIYPRPISEASNRVHRAQRIGPGVGPHFCRQGVYNNNNIALGLSPFPWFRSYWRYVCLTQEFSTTL